MKIEPKLTDYCIVAQLQTLGDEIEDLIPHAQGKQ
jgi:hypothetical protein